MSPTSRTPGHSAVKSRPIRSGLVTACTGPGGALAGTWLTRLQAELAYQVGDQADAARDAVTIERGGHPPTAVGAPRGGEHLPHVDGQLTPARGAGGLGPFARRRTSTGTPRAAGTSTRSGSSPAPRRSPRTAPLRVRPGEEGRGLSGTRSPPHPARLILEFLHAPTLHR